ncbi:MAG: DegV family protein [Clostridiales bacterium]|jgi:fatty acid-binding protein DegV|nr:DegV family protein [Clostridiales bacterium]
MDFQIVADSCCDLTPEIKKQWGVTTVPLTMTLDNKSYTDDETLNLPEFMTEMKNCSAKIGSASPSPLLYKEAFEAEHASFAVTLSSRLSGSYSSGNVLERGTIWKTGYWSSATIATLSGRRNKNG